MGQFLLFFLKNKGALYEEQSYTLVVRFTKRTPGYLRYTGYFRSRSVTSEETSTEEAVENKNNVGHNTDNKKLPPKETPLAPDGAEKHLDFLKVHVRSSSRNASLMRIP